MDYKLIRGSPAFSVAPTVTPTPAAVVEVFAGGGRTDSSGVFRIEGLAPGSYRLQALVDYTGFTRAYLEDSGAPATVEIVGGQVSVGHEILLTASGAVAGNAVYHGAYPGPLVIGFYADAQFTNLVR